MEEKKPFMAGQLFRGCGTPGPFFEVVQVWSNTKGSAYRVRLLSHLNAERSLIQEEVMDYESVLVWLEDRVDY